MKKNSIVLLLPLFFMAHLYAKVLVITHAFNRPDFIELQYKTFKKFLKDEYEFVVFNDAERDPRIYKKIVEVCNKLHIPCISIPQAIHDKPYLYRPQSESNLWNSPCVRAANVVQYSLDYVGFDYDGIVAIIDSDMFLIQDFSIENFLEGCDIAGLSQSRGHVNYLWNGIVFFNMRTLPHKKSLNWNCGKIDGQPVDVGGYTYYFFKNNPEARIKYTNNCYIKNNADVVALLKERGLNDDEIKFLVDDPYGSEFHVDKAFLHYRAGGNWNNMPQNYHDIKTSVLNKFMNSCLR
jgi:hypothetical protein